MEDACLFCKIIDGQIDCEKVYEDNKVLAFRDINPQAPVHVLVIPKEHFNDIVAIDEETMGGLLEAVKKIVRDEGVAKSGFRMITNTGNDGGQVVKHIHWHILGGRTLGPTMG